jgi:CxxC motif-containing protein (DUF1111 family)
MSGKRTVMIACLVLEGCVGKADLPSAPVAPDAIDSELSANGGSFPDSGVVDPGPRFPSFTDGQPLPGVLSDPTLGGTFQTGQDLFLGFFQIRAPMGGVGPLYNAPSCSMCHGGLGGAGIGGGSPAVNPQGPNGLAANFFSGTKNVIPSFETASGPALQVILKRSVGGFPAGSVQQLFTVSGASEMPTTCVLSQPNFAQEIANGAIAFRQPAQLLGTGLIDSISAQTLTENLISTAAARADAGIGGQLNLVNDQVGKFGWKAQVASLATFTGLALGREMGITNIMFPIENDPLDPQGRCIINPVPEDGNAFIPTGPPGTGTSLLPNITVWEMLTAPPQPVPAAQQPPDAAQGQALFSSVGCSLCHTPALTTTGSSLAPLSQVQANLYSDLALHHMGACLSDGLPQGLASADMYRTPPLWGVGERHFFLHDGRETNIWRAVEEHGCAAQSGYFPSEANAVLARFNALSGAQQQAVVDFLRSL